jgi:hypothetical protein
MIQRLYASNEIDAFAVYCADVERCFYLPFAVVDGRAGVHLRLSPARNNQECRVKWADDFDFERLHWDDLKGP